MTITLIYNDTKFTLEQDKGVTTSTPLTLAQAIFWSGCVPARPLCAGIASCGRCKVRFLSKAPELTQTEEKILTKVEKDTHIRLSCRHRAQDGMIIELLPDNTQDSQKKLKTSQSSNILKQDIFEPDILKPDILKQNISNPNTSYANTPYALTKTDTQEQYKYRLFVDIGTTSIAWQCCPIHNITEKNAQKASSQELSTLITYSGGALNPQMIAGADVMARLHSANSLLKASGKPHFLQELVQDYLENTIQELEASSCPCIEIVEIFVAANSAIMALTLGTDSSGLCTAPYILSDFGNRYAHIATLPPLWIAPQMSAFIGADACSGLAYILSLLTNEFQQKAQSTASVTSDQKNTSHAYENTIFLLADMGTNGEFILFDGSTKEAKITAASVPLGPAIEGVGMRFGAPVHGDTQHIILSFQLGMQGLEYNCSGTPKHICGAAYLSLIHILLSLNILNRQGFFQIPSQEKADNSFFHNQSPLAKKITKNIRIENEEIRLYITDKLYICSEDIENILKVKSAFATAISLLTKEALEDKSLTQLYLSGSLADYIPLTHLENLGFIPQGASKYTKILGNSSLKGLLALAHNPKLKEELILLVEQAQTLDLTANPIFAEEFIENMHF